MMVMLHSIATVMAVIAFLAVGWWAYSPQNKRRFEQDASVVLDDVLVSAHQQKEPQ